MDFTQKRQDKTDEIMKTEILKLPQAGDAAYRRAAELLQAGGLVAFPTETVYGLGGNALDPEASRKIYAAKGRPSDNPLIVHVAELDAVPPLVQEVPEQAKRLMERFWPGPLTIILKASNLVPRETTGGLATVALRMPDHPVALEMIRAAGCPVAAPSANTSGRPSPTRASHVAEDLCGKIDLILDGGEVGIGVESTIVDLTGDIPVILRPGYITKAMLEEVLGTVKIDPAIAKINEGTLLTGDEPPKAPGMKYRHYAPKAPLTLVQGTAEAVFEKLKELAVRSKAEGQRVGIICADDAPLDFFADVVYHVGSRDDRLEQAQKIYDVLRQCDEDGLDVIYADDFGLELDEDLGYAVQNRLMKAAGGRIIREDGEGET
jgi:L-threonylcarbamoyladenylate synthase